MSNNMEAPLNDWKFLASFIACALLTFFLCFYVFWSFLKSPERREPPAPLMSIKTLTDFVFALLTYLMIMLPADSLASITENTDNDGDTDTSDTATVKSTDLCQILGALTLGFFVLSQGYLAGICWDLRLTLLNPFRKPASDSWKLHVIVWFSAIILVSIVYSLEAFQYRTDYYLCLTCDTAKKFNVYNLIVLYLPLLFSNLSGIFVTLHVWVRLSQGLTKTFELRQTVIRRQSTLVVCYTGLSLVSGVVWIVAIWIPQQFSNETDKAHNDWNLCVSNEYDNNSNSNNAIPYLFVFIVFVQPFADALAWYLVSRNNKKYKKLKKVSKMLKDENEDDDNNGNNKNGNGSKNSGSKRNSNNNNPNDDTESFLKNEDEDKTEPKKQKSQNLSNALRNEIVAYMTEGLAQSVRNTALETWKQYHSHNHMGIHHNQQSTDDMYDEFDEFADLEQHNEQMMMGRQSIMNNQNVTNEEIMECVEPTPPMAYYPENLDLNASVHQSTINKFEVDLGRQRSAISNRQRPLSHTHTSQYSQTHSQNMILNKQESQMNEVLFEPPPRVSLANQSTMHSTASSNVTHGTSFITLKSSNFGNNRGASHQQSDTTNTNNTTDINTYETDFEANDINVENLPLIDDLHEDNINDTMVTTATTVDNMDVNSSVIIHGNNDNSGVNDEQIVIKMTSNANPLDMGDDITGVTDTTTATTTAKNTDGDSLYEEMTTTANDNNNNLGNEQQQLMQYKRSYSEADKITVGYSSEDAASNNNNNNNNNSNNNYDSINSSTNENSESKTNILITKGHSRNNSHSGNPSPHKKKNLLQAQTIMAIKGQKRNQNAYAQYSGYGNTPGYSHTQHGLTPGGVYLTAQQSEKSLLQSITSGFFNAITEHGGAFFGDKSIAPSRPLSRNVSNNDENDDNNNMITSGGTNRMINGSLVQNISDPNSSHLNSDDGTLQGSLHNNINNLTSRNTTTATIKTQLTGSRGGDINNNNNDSIGVQDGTNASSNKLISMNSYTNQTDYNIYQKWPFKDYGPHVFRYLRTQIYGVSDSEYLESIRPNKLEQEMGKVNAKFSEGRSGAFFFFSYDSKYIIKTIPKSEAAFLLRILQRFVNYLGKSPLSRICRIFGLHSLEMYNLTLYFVVLENVFVAGTDPHEKYDIKGSWIDRHTNHHVESGKLMKDEDLHKTLKLLPEEASKIYKQLKSDSKFLADCNIMDYSLLLGIYYVGIDPEHVSSVRKDKYGPNSNGEMMAAEYDDHEIGVQPSLINQTYEPPAIGNERNERKGDNEDEEDDDDDEDAMAERMLAGLSASKSRTHQTDKENKRRDTGGNGNGNGNGDGSGILLPENDGKEEDNEESILTQDNINRHNKMRKQSNNNNNIKKNENKNNNGLSLRKDTDVSVEMSDMTKKSSNFGKKNGNQSSHSENKNSSKTGSRRSDRMNSSFLSFPRDLQTVRSMPDDAFFRNENRQPPPSYDEGMKQVGRNEKAIKARVIEGPGIYYVGIIDCLQEWNTQKKMEHFLKVYFRCKNKNGISCVEPQYYRKRFLRKMFRIGIRAPQDR